MEEQRITFGFSPSVMDGSEQIFEAVDGMEIPEEYSYVEYMSPVLDQGATNTCVPSSISAHLNWNWSVDTDNDNNAPNIVNIQDIYSQRSIPGDNGMYFKDALSYLRHKGTPTQYGVLTIDKYALIQDAEALKQALILNGPCVGGLMVYNMGPYFWDKNVYQGNFGGHAISIVGYTKEGFIIRNSWGSNWAFNGYTVIKYEDFPLIVECWTIID